MKRRELDKQLREMGFSLYRSTRHPIYHHRDGGPPLVLAGSGSDHRELKNDLTRARRIIRGLA